MQFSDDQHIRSVFVHFEERTMMTTADSPATEGMLFLPRQGFVNHWGAIPLMCWIAIVGMPLQRKLEVSQPVWTPDMYASTLAATSNAGSLQSIPFVVFMASIYILAGFMLLRKPKTALSTALRQWPLLLLLLFVATSMLWSSSQEKALINIANNVGVTLVTLAAALRYQTEPWLLPKHLGYVLGFNIFIQLACVMLLPSFAIEWEGRWRGLTGQANELGGIAFCAFWANAVILSKTRNDKYHLHLLFAVCAVTAMIGANSMTSIISSICVLVSICLLAWKSSQRRGKQLFISGIGISVLIVTIGIVFLGDALDLEKLLGLAGRTGSFTGRTDIWMLATNAISVSPWIGWGFDGNNYLIKITGMPYTSYHNGYLDLLVCGGATGLGLFILILGNWLYQVKKRTRIGSDILPFTVPFIVSMLIYNLMEATLVASRNQMWIIFLVLVFLSCCTKKQLPVVDAGQWRTGLTPLARIHSSAYSH
jgi:O-antigen ligase